MAQTALINASVCISKLPIDWLEKTEFTSIIHFHCIFARAIHMIFVRGSSVGPICYVDWVNGCKSWAHSNHHLGWLRARVDWRILGCGSLSCLLLLNWFNGCRRSIVMRIDLTGLTYPNSFALASDFNVGIGLASNDDVLFNQLNCVVLAIWDLLRRVTS